MGFNSGFKGLMAIVVVLDGNINTLFTFYVILTVHKVTFCDHMENIRHLL